MAHFAELNADTLEVVRVLVVPDEQQARGGDYLASDLGLGGTWLQTSYNDNIRGRFAAPGMFYNAALDMFIAAQPYPSWSLDGNGDWQAPVAYPADGNYTWDEETLSWLVQE